MWLSPNYKQLRLTEGNSRGRTWTWTSRFSSNGFFLPPSHIYWICAKCQAIINCPHPSCNLGQERRRNRTMTGLRTSPKGLPTKKVWSPLPLPNLQWEIPDLTSVWALYSVQMSTHEDIVDNFWMHWSNQHQKDLSPSEFLSNIPTISCTSGPRHCWDTVKSKWHLTGGTQKLTSLCSSLHKRTGGDV